MRRILDSGLEMLLTGCLGESADGIEVRTLRDGGEAGTSVTLSIRELSPTMPLADVSTRPQGYLSGRGLRRETGLMLLGSLPANAHSVGASRAEGSFTYSVRFQLPKLRQEEKKSTGGSFSGDEPGDGET